MQSRTPVSRQDVCIVGAGPAGALIAHRLASAGNSAVVLEAGPRFDFDDREEQMERSIRPAHDDLSVWDMGGERDEFSTGGDRFYPLNHARVKGVGGSTLHWQGMVMRLHESDFDGELPNDDPAWPIDYEELRPHYAEAESAFGVAGSADNPFAPPRDSAYPMAPFGPSYSDSLFAPACESLGITTHTVPNARNSTGYDDRSACVGYGTCKPVCPSGAKYSADHHVAKAEEEGATVVDRAPVQRLETDDDSDDNRVEAAVYATPDGTEHRQEAREFVLAAGGIEIPRLLLLSASSDHPDGLANSSGAVGRYFMDHLFAGVGGTIDRETRQNHVGFITSESHQFYDDPGQAVRRDGQTVIEATDEPLSPIKLEFLNYAGPSPVETALGAENWGDSLLEDLREGYGNSIAMGGLIGQPPRRENRVTLDSDATDDHGNPVPKIVWSWGDRLERTLARANEIQRTVLDEMGAEVTWTAGPGSSETDWQRTTGPAFHHMGTTRMGTDPEESVVDPSLRTHDVGNLSVASSSVFPTSGSMNPTLTIGALALRLSDHLADRL